MTPILQLTDPEGDVTEATEKGHDAGNPDNGVAVPPLKHHDGNRQHLEECRGFTQKGGADFKMIVEETQHGAPDSWTQPVPNHRVDVQPEPRLTKKHAC